MSSGFRIHPYLMFDSAVFATLLLKIRSKVLTNTAGVVIKAATSSQTVFKRGKETWVGYFTNNND